MAQVCQRRGLVDKEVGRGLEGVPSAHWSLSVLSKRDPVAQATASAIEHGSLSISFAVE